MKELSHTDSRNIREVICAQLRALSMLDGDQALKRLTPERRTGTGQRFLQSISNVFPQLAQVWKAQFGDIRLHEGQYAQWVRITAHDRTTLEAVFLLARQEDGTWLIDRCVCRTPEQQSSVQQLAN